MRGEFKILPEQPAKYEAGKLLVINGMMMGMVLSSFWEYNDRHYRMFVDANEIAYRMRNKHFEQQDYMLNLIDAAKEGLRLSIQTIQDEKFALFMPGYGRIGIYYHECELIAKTFN